MTMLNIPGSVDPHGGAGSTSPADGEDGATHPGGSSAEAHASHGHSGHRRKKADANHLPSRNAILATLARLPQLVATGLMTPGQSNSIHGIMRTLLQNLPSAEGASVPADTKATLRDVLKDNPDLLHALAPMMSDDDLDDLVDDKEP
jgi:hypothetical protein